MISWVLSVAAVEFHVLMHKVSLGNKCAINYLTHGRTGTQELTKGSSEQENMLGQERPAWCLEGSEETAWKQGHSR